MEKTKPTIKDEKKLELTTIKGTPFTHATDGDRNYVITGKMILETEKNKEETEEWLKEKPWEAISMICEAITREILKENKNNNNN